MKPIFSRMRSVAIVGASIAILVAAFRLTEAGSLTPTAAPAGTMTSLNALYASLASDSFDASAIVASRSGGALQISKCIIARATGGSCP
ncbi:MAG: hypothetical protein IT406_01615 [Candidatus Yanofskybacteria bacterium]|nr:hypothetical protein [Candidatus Yanofskybacteria bacterium]